MIGNPRGKVRRPLRTAGLLLTSSIFYAGIFLSCGGDVEDDTRGIEKYTATFESAEEMKDWKTSDSGTWVIKDGSLYGDARIPEQRSILWLDKPVPRNLQVEFDAECLEKPGDINCFLNGDGLGYSGYEIVIAGWENSRIVIYRADQKGNPIERRRVGRDDFDVEKGQVYHVKIRKEGNTFHVWVDDELLITEIDREPLRVEGDCYFGLSTWENVVRFDNLKIERRKAQ